eukprot:scaffold385117_cov24-Prasinocladus_malaysianus.AAC.1
MQQLKSKPACMQRATTLHQAAFMMIDKFDVLSSSCMRRLNIKNANIDLTFPAIGPQGGSLIKVPRKQDFSS